MFKQSLIGLRAAGASRAAATERAALLSLSGDRCVLPLYKLAVGSIVQGEAAIAASWRWSDNDGEMKSKGGWGEGQKREEVVS